jgi:peptide/nickel transport system ATP-binding protein
MTTPTPLLEVVDLCKRFIKRRDRKLPGGHAPAAVEQVSFSITRSGIFGLVGESGAGKSTIARLLMRLVKPDSGRILLNGQDLTRMTTYALQETRRQVQIVFQDSLAALSPRRRIGQTLLEPLEWHAIGAPAERGNMVAEVLETVGMNQDCLSRFPHELSGGQRQRICLARALILEPQLVIADEALSALDVSLQARVISLLRRLRDEKGVAFLLISHDLAVIRQLADHVGVLYRGRLVEQAAADEQAVPAPDPGQQTAWSTPSVAGPAPKRACLFSHRCEYASHDCTRTEPRNHNVATGVVKHQVRCHLHADSPE